MGDYGILMFQLLVLLWGVGLPVWVATSLVKNSNLDGLTRVLLIGLTIVVPVVGPIASSILAERARKEVASA